MYSLCIERILHAQKLYHNHSAASIPIFPLYPNIQKSKQEKTVRPQQDCKQAIIARLAAIHLEFTRPHA